MLRIRPRPVRCTAAAPLAKAARACRASSAKRPSGTSTRVARAVLCRAAPDPAGMRGVWERAGDGMLEMPGRTVLSSISSIRALCDQRESALLGTTFLQPAREWRSDDTTAGPTPASPALLRGHSLLRRLWGGRRERASCSCAEEADGEDAADLRNALLHRHALKGIKQQAFEVLIVHVVRLPTEAFDTGVRPWASPGQTAFGVNPRREA